jgi:hypothetical protein
VEVSPGSKTGLVYCRKIADFKKDTLYPIIETYPLYQPHHFLSINAA